MWFDCCWRNTVAQSEQSRCQNPRLKVSSVEMPDKKGETFERQPENRRAEFPQVEQPLLLTDIYELYS